MPTDESRARAVASASFLSTFRWWRSDSVICLPIFMTGLSEVMGSWKTMPISAPQTSLMRFWSYPMMSVPS